MTPSIAPTPNSTDPLLADLAEDIKPAVGTITNEDGEQIVPQTGKSVQPLSDKEADANTAMFIEIRELAIGGLLAWYADGKIMEYSKYKLEQAAKKELIAAWTPVIQKSGIKVGPWAKILITEVIHGLPMGVLASNNRKLRLANEAKDRQIAALQAQLAQEERAKGNEVVMPQGSARMNNKNAWKIDADGFFEYQSDGRNYIKKADRTERPELPADLEMLYKYNDKKIVHQVFELPLTDTDA